MQSSKPIRHAHFFPRFAAGIATLLLAASTACGQNADAKPETAEPQVNVNVLRQDKYKGKLDGVETTATMLEVILDPLAGSPPHRHPGPLSGFVIEGTFEFQVEGGPIQTLKAGDAFFEPKMILHKVGRNPDKEKRTRVLATIVHPSDAKSLVIMEPIDGQAQLSTETFAEPRALSAWSAKDSSGDSVSVADFSGNPFVLLMFRGHGCYHCVQQLGAFAEAEKKFRDRGVSIVALSNEPVAQIKDALKKTPLPFTVLSDAESTLAKSLGSEEIDNWHGLLIVDADGNARTLTSGSQPLMEIDRLLAELDQLGLTGDSLSSYEPVKTVNPRQNDSHLNFLK